MLGTVRKGIIRYLVVIVDVSSGLEVQDMKPSRIVVVQNALVQFLKEYFDQNPLSQLSLIFSRNGIAERMTELSGNARQHLQVLENRFRTSVHGNPPSLQNSLEMAHSTLAQVPQYGCREVLVLYSSLCTVDPGDISQSIKTMQDTHIRCSAVGFGGELFVLRKLSSSTGGQYLVPLNEDHYKEQLMGFAVPPAMTPQMRQPAELIRMGFPRKVPENKYNRSICVCHQQVRSGGYLCPRCNGKYCEIPTVCQICGLTLVASPHLARSYHHLFPAPPFDEWSTDQSQVCFACLQTIMPGALVLRCSSCSHIFCADCDTFVHDSLHNCPGCCTSRLIVTTPEQQSGTQHRSSSSASLPVLRSSLSSSSSFFLPSDVE